MGSTLRDRPLHRFLHGALAPLIAVAVTLASMAPLWGPPGDVERVAVEVSLGHMPPGAWRGNSLETSPDHRHLAYVGPFDFGWRVRTGTRKLQPIRSPLDLPDVLLHGRKYVHATMISPDVETVDYRDRVLVDGIEIGSWDEVRHDSHRYMAGLSYLRFSADSRHLAFVVREGKKWSIVIDGRPGKGYDEILAGVMWDSPRRFHYLAREGDRVWRVEETMAR